MTILCEFDDQAAAEITPLLVGVIIAAANLPEAAVAVSENAAENLVLVGSQAPLDQVLDFAAKALIDRPSLVVILVRKDYDPAAIDAALRAGVREVVPAGDTQRLLDACRRAAGVMVPAAPLVDEPLPAVEVPAERTEAPPAEPVEAPPLPSVPAVGKVITVFSPKGGSGKTTIATNLAVALHETGLTVCLIDLDLEFGDVAISLRLTPTRSIVDAVTTEIEGDEDDALRMLTTEYKPGLNTILAPIEPGDAEKIPADLVSDLIALLKTRYGFVVVDTPSQFSENVLAALDASDYHVLLTNPEIPALKSLRLTLDMLDMLHYPRDRRLVVFNRADNSAGLTAADVEETIKSPITAHVPASRDVPASINKGVPIVASLPDHPVSVAIRTFAAEHIAGRPIERQKRTKRSIFRRRSG